MSIISKILKPKIFMPTGTIKQPKQASHKSPMANHSYMAVPGAAPAKRASKVARPATNKRSARLKATSTVMGIPKGKYK